MEPKDWSLMPEAEKIYHFNEVLESWREPGIVPIQPSRVIPDTTNRSNTGLSVEHVHYIATKIVKEGFQPRSGSGETSQGHDIPILIRESVDSNLGAESLTKWKRQLDEQAGFPRLQLFGKNKPTPSDPHHEFFTSLGNGHFFQALNVFGTNHECIWPDIATGGRWHFDVGDDVKLRRAVLNGVPAVVLSGRIPRRARKFLSEVLNSSFGFRWNVDEETGGATLNSDVSIEATQASAFESLSKSLDAHELGLLVRQKIGISTSRMAKTSSKL